MGHQHSLAATGSIDPCLEQRVAAELEQIEAVSLRHARRVAIVPWLIEEPVGPVRLLAIARGKELEGQGHEGDRTGSCRSGLGGLMGSNGGTDDFLRSTKRERASVIVSEWQ